MNYQIKTNNKTMKTVWNILDDLNLAPLLFGKQPDFDLYSLLNGLYRSNKLNDLCQAITGSTDDFDEKEPEEVIEVLANFFGTTINRWKGLIGIFSQ